jgi:hypothetical protein
MPKKRPARRKKSIGKKKATLYSRAVRSKKAIRAKKPARRKKAVRSQRSSRGVTPFDVAASLGRRGLGPGAGGQSGDVQGLSRAQEVDSESVTELAEEGQDFEAEVVSGVENAPDADKGEVRTKEVPEDDVPPEYLDKG